MSITPKIPNNTPDFLKQATSRSPTHPTPVITSPTIPFPTSPKSPEAEREFTRMICTEKKFWVVRERLGSGASKTVHSATELKSDEVHEIFERTLGSPTYVKERTPTSPEGVPRRSFSTVVDSCVENLPGTPVAIAFIQLMGTQGEMEKINQEIKIVQLCMNLKIPNIHLIFEAKPLFEAGEVCIISELCDGGTLKTWKAKDELELQNALKALAITVKLLHDHNIVHWDIKPENVLLKDGKPKLADFGTSWILGNTQFPQRGSAEGTCEFRSPFPRGPKESPKSRDVFALGATMYYALTGTKLHEDVYKLAGRTDRIEPHFFMVITKPEMIQTLLEEKLSKNPLAKDLLMSMLSLDPNRECTMDEVVAHPYFSCMPKTTQE